MKMLLPSGVSAWPVAVVRWNVDPLVQTMPSRGSGAAAWLGDAVIEATTTPAIAAASSLRQRSDIGLSHDTLGRQRRALIHPDLRDHPAQPGRAVVGQAAEVAVAEQVRVVGPP